MTQQTQPSADDIPIGREHAITRMALRIRWGCTDRMMRRTIADLRAEDNGDDYVIVSYSSGKGYYRTDNPDEIRHFINEQSKRARSTFRPLAKARRVLKRLEVNTDGGD